MNQEPLANQPSQQLSIGDISSPGDDNVTNIIQGNDVVVTVNKTFNRTEIFQISVDVIKTREFRESSPYKGLRRFESVDKDLFFGRDQFLTGLVNELNQTNFILLLGASGSGKSSVVRAGLIPWLSREWGSKFTDLTFTPNLEPFNSFYQRLHDRYQQAEAQFVLEGKAETLSQTVKRLQPPKDFWFIFIDQFEELFTLSQADQRDRFIGSLVQMIHTLNTDQNRLVKVVATMRADFLDRLSPYPELIKATNQHRPMIAEMQLDELRLAIEQPAAHHGVVFETGLVEEIIKDVQGQAGYLPLLQYTLNLLWETEVQTGSIRDRTLNISNYRSLGGVRGALQKHVEEVYQRLSEAEQLAAQRIFLKLIGIGGNAESGTEWKPVRRRASRTEFDDPLEQRIAVRLINENLLVSNRETQSQESTVEIAHEVLLTSWTTLSVWIRENRQAIALRNRLNDDVARWQVKKEEEELWGGSKLEQVLELRNDPTFNQVLGGLSSTANQFIDSSLEKRDRHIREEEERQQRELDQTRKLLAEEQKARTAAETARKSEERARKAAQIRTVAVGVSAAAILATGSFFWWQQQQLQLTFYDIWSGVNLDESKPTNAFSQSLYSFWRRVNPNAFQSTDALKELLNKAKEFKQAADQRGNESDIQRSIAYYRLVRAEASKRNLKLLFDQTEKPLSALIDAYRIPLLKQELKKARSTQKFGSLIPNSDATQFEQRYTKGALRTTYAVLMRDLGTKADLNDDGVVGNKAEADMLPCDILQRIQELWQKATNDRCDWYDPLSKEFQSPTRTHSAPSCLQLNGQTLTEVIFNFAPQDWVIDRLNICKIAPKPLKP